MKTKEHSKQLCKKVIEKHETRQFIKYPTVKSIIKKWNEYGTCKSIYGRPGSEFHGTQVIRLNDLLVDFSFIATNALCVSTQDAFRHWTELLVTTT